MAKGVEISTNEEHFVGEALKLGFRTDGRTLTQAREPVIKLSDQYGYVEIVWGRTKLAVRISAEITQPYEDRPFEGLFTINTEISPMASPHFENGKNSDEEVLIARLVEKAIRRSNALDLESLCIVAGSKVWSIRADIHFLDFDGGLIDASCLGVMTALQHFRKPDVSVVGENVVIHSVDERQPVPLSILHVPICVTFSFYNPSGVEENIKGDLNEEISIIDATQQEELLRDGSLVITINKNRELIQISKSGGLPIDAMVLMDLSRKAYVIAEELTEKVKQLLKVDEEERYKRLNLKLLESGERR
ncbi:exosome complex component Rrp45p [[Candida] anglica]|uniref:Exosome complex component Rrp45p n=1 Tax=[Candida] anglica TaxID=148631 RepID=A0ABP0EI89_9ASCO